jgi:hypothetical protein
VNVVNNHCTADAATMNNCFTLTSQGFPLVAPYISQTSITTNTFSNALHTLYAPVASVSAPTLQAVTAPGFATLAAGTYYVTVQPLSLACTANQSPESSITVSAGQMIRVSPPSVSDPNVFGYFINIGTVSGTHYVQFINSWSPINLPYDQSTAITTNQLAVNTNCTGATLAHGFQFALLSPTSLGFAQQAPGLVEENNQSNNTLVQYTNLRKISNYLLPDAVAHVGVVKLRPYRPRSYRISFQTTVQTAPTTISASVTWTDPNGGARTQQIAAGELYPVGSRTFNDFTITSGTAIDISVNVSAGTANQVYVTTSIADN